MSYPSPISLSRDQHDWCKNGTNSVETKGYDWVVPRNNIPIKITIPATRQLSLQNTPLQSNSDSAFRF
ncbi:hypothetical protein EU537_02845 [Candidatus Thorarchaeota archaeon]|nr:MAG: hypothetical protein EU537_02845 [Candidatus Thorarchaeota archaeon]